MARRSLVVGAIALVAVAGAGVRVVPSGAAGLLDSPVRQDRLVAGGLRWRVPLLERIHVLDPYRRRTDLPYRTPEGAQIEIALAVAVRLDPGRAAGLLDAQGGGSARERLDRAVDALVLERIAGSVDEWSIPTLDDRLRNAIRASLSRYGEVEGEVGLQFSEDSPVAMAIGEAALWERIRRERTDTGVRVLIVGLDGADWQIAGPLIEQGRLPTLARLREGGAWGNVKALTPVLSPLLWTSVATGVTADRHGVLDFLMRDPATGRTVPVSSRFRRVRALWNLYSEAGLSADVVAWWATWPAEAVEGHLVSDRVAYSLFDFDLPTGGSGATWPPGYIEEIRPGLIDAETVGFAEVTRFIDVTREEFERAREKIGEDRASAYRDPINHLTKIIAATRNYHRIALDLLRGGQADLTAVYYQGIDEVGHRFMHFAPPRMDGVDAEDVRRFGGAVERFYEWQDELLGELLDAADPDTTVIVLSDHGFLNRADRPAGQTADIEGQPGRWHRPYGLLVMAGPAVVPGELDTASLLDVTPTVLYLAGLPLSADFSGRVLEEAIATEFRERVAVSTIDSYEITPFRVDAPARDETLAEAEAEIVENLRALGYVGSEGSGPEAPGSGGSGAATVTYHANLAAVLLSSGDLEGAEREILAALALEPRFPVAKRQLFTVRVRQQRYDEALALADDVLAEDDVDERFLLRVADAYHDAGRSAEGIRVFEERATRGDWRMAAPLARLRAASGDAVGAERAAREVLERDPTSPGAMGTLFRVAAARGGLDELQPLLERALERQPRSVMHLNWLAVVHEARGDVATAERLLQRALDANPDHGGSMANLGVFWARHGRVDDAIGILERAIRIDPDNVDARVNLGTAFARAKRFDEAAAQFRDAYERGRRTAEICNAIARAEARRGRLDVAAQWLGRSLEIEPDQPRVRDTLERLRRRPAAQNGHD